MDPLSITTACMAAIGTITKASVEVPRFISSVREARRDMEAVLRELTSLTLCLGVVRDDADIVTFPTTLLAVVKSCEEIAGEIIRLMDKLRVKKTGRIRWNLTERDEVNKLRSSLESHKSCIDVALDMASIQLLAAVKDDTSVIKTQTTAIKANTENIKQDTAQISGLVEEIALLRLQVSQLKQESGGGGGGGVTLQRFLEETSSYAESVIDATELDKLEPGGKDYLSVIYSEDWSDRDSAGDGAESKTGDTGEVSTTERAPEGSVADQTGIDKGWGTECFREMAAQFSRNEQMLAEDSQQSAWLKREPRRKKAAGVYRVHRVSTDKLWGSAILSRTDKSLDNSRADQTRIEEERTWNKSAVTFPESDDDRRKFSGPRSLVSKDPICVQQPRIPQSVGSNRSVSSDTAIQFAATLNAKAEEVTSRAEARERENSGGVTSAPFRARDRYLPRWDTELPKALLPTPRGIDDAYPQPVMFRLVQGRLTADPEAMQSRQSPGRKQAASESAKEISPLRKEDSWFWPKNYPVSWAKKSSTIA